MEVVDESEVPGVVGIDFLVMSARPGLGCPCLCIHYRWPSSSTPQN